MEVYVKSQSFVWIHSIPRQFLNANAFNESFPQRKNLLQRFRMYFILDPGLKGVESTSYAAANSAWIGWNQAESTALMDFMPSIRDFIQNVFKTLKRVFQPCKGFLEIICNFIQIHLNIPTLHLKKKNL